MNKIITIIVLLSAFGCNALFAKNKGAVITNASLKKEQAHIRISFDINMDKLSPDYMLVITPSLIAGQHSKAMEPYVLTGRRRRIMDERAGNDTGSYARASKRNGDYHYSAAIPYEKWMQNVTLRINQQIEGCCDMENLASADVLSNMLVPYEIVPHYDRDPLPVMPVERIEKELDQFSFVYPMSIYADRHDMLKMESRSANSATVFFRVNRVDIEPSFRNNSAALDLVTRALDVIESTPGLKLGKVMIAGFSSPEGTLEVNTKLSGARMNALKNYLEKRKNYDNYLFDLFNGGEDWEGLRYFVEKSDMKYRNEVLDIIDNIQLLNGREKKLMELGGGEPYKYMLKNFFPDLRNAGYIQIYYDETGEINAKIAAENASIDILNKATDLINRKDYPSAMSLLEQINNDPRAFNLIGICHMMTDEYDKAEGMFKKAIQAGDNFAPKNMSEIEKARMVN
ncbi:hypothetical protein [uncultured Proteiniphilum sp.]|uniref:hypothetical protein n=1 Tax=uncultured Proteiniphilum sp. TaxID=497637 RepID=UPI0026319DF8|nr:hypothetical protein [uncultured Proteiniphilum sp.]